jgi:CHAD domain-containing protein
MSFRISPGAPFGEDIRRIAREQIDGAVAGSGDGSASDSERIHSIRKHCKKLRGLLRLVRPCLGTSYDSENAHFRDVAQVLAPLRDRHVVLAAFDAVVGHFEGEVTPGTFAPLRHSLARRQRQPKDLAARFADVCGRMEAARERVADWPLDVAGPEVWRSGFERTYRQARRALAAACQEPTAERFHEWRKSAKYHWYHTRLLSPLWDQALEARAQAASTLGELLGLHHDLAVLRAALVGRRAAGSAAGLTDSFVALIDRHQAHVERTARSLGMRLFAEKASRIGSRYEKYWTVSLEEVEGRGTTVPPAVRASA